MKTYTAAQMREQERLAVERGTTFEQLMENAGQSAAADLLHRLPQPKRVLAVCGRGNNGGDGLVMVRALQAHGWQADVLFAAGGKLSELSERNRSRLLGLPRVNFVDAGKLADCLKTGYDLIIDGIFGTGFAGSLPADIAETCRLLNRAGGLKVALDIPTGLNCDTGEADADAFRADLTYTFAARKPAHLTDAGKALCGEIVCLDIGI